MPQRNRRTRTADTGRQRLGPIAFTWRDRGRLWATLHRTAVGSVATVLCVAATAPVLFMVSSPSNTGAPASPEVPTTIPATEVAGISVTVAPAVLPIEPPATEPPPTEPPVITSRPRPINVVMAPPPETAPPATQPQPETAPPTTVPPTTEPPTTPTTEPPVVTTPETPPTTLPTTTLPDKPSKRGRGGGGSDDDD